MGLNGPFEMFALGYMRGKTECGALSNACRALPAQTSCGKERRRFTPTPEGLEVTRLKSNSFPKAELT